MKHFWHGFHGKTAAQVQFKRHVVLVYWKPGEDASVKDSVKRLSSRYPSVKVKVINVEKDPSKPLRHQVLHFPTVLLLKDGREVDRVGEEPSMALLEQLFRKAHV